ncbi:MAG: cation transporter [Gemmataceae bacterium]
MSFARVARTLGAPFLGLIILAAGCSRPATPPAKPAPVAVQQAPNPDELIVGKWELVRDPGDKQIDWAFIDDSLNGKDVVMRIDGAGNLSLQPADAESGPETAYVFVDETLEIKPPEQPGPKQEPEVARKPQRLRAVVNAKELVLNDEKNRVLRFRRAAATPGDVKISGLPMCCNGCSIALKKELTKVPGLSDLKVDLKSKSATLKVNDTEQVTRLATAIRRAGMHGIIEVNGKPAGPTFNVLGTMQGEDTLVLRGVHACCGGCEANFKAALKDVKDVAIDFKGEGSVKTVTLKADKLDTKKVIEDLGKAGFHIKLETEPPKPAPKENSK